jgi:hypothetical protein
MGPAFASPGVAVKQVGRNAIAKAIAFIEAVFMLVSNDKVVPPFNVKNFSCGCDYKKIHTGSVAWSNDNGATIIEVDARLLPDFCHQAGSVIRCIVDRISPA